MAVILLQHVPFAVPWLTTEGISIPIVIATTIITTMLLLVVAFHPCLPVG